MPIKRAIWVGVAAYAATFLVGLIVVPLLGLEVSPATGEIPLLALYGAIIITMLIMGAATWWFFRAPEAVANYWNGFLFGIVSLAIGFVLDFASVLPFGNPIKILGPYYARPEFFVMLLLMLATTTGIGFWLGGRPALPSRGRPAESDEEAKAPPLAE